MGNQIPELKLSNPIVKNIDDINDKYRRSNNVTIIKEKLINGWDDPSVDGIQLVGSGLAHVRHCVVTRTGYNPVQADELASAVDGADVVFYRCRFMDNGKGYLQGTGDTPNRDLQKIQRSVFYECIFDGNSRRNPFIQIGQGYMSRCLIRNWGQRFHLKSFGARAGNWGQLLISNCIFEQESFLSCLKRGHLFWDTFGHYLFPLPGMPGFMRGAYAEGHGSVLTHECYKNRWWIYLQNRMGDMSKGNAMLLKAHLDEVVPNVPPSK